MHQSAGLRRRGGESVSERRDGENDRARFQSGREPRDVLVWLTLYDYEGEKPLNASVGARFRLEPGKTQSVAKDIPLTATGCVLARATVIDAAKPAEGKPVVAIDSSEIPLTSLPYEKSATKPDFRGRFGGSFAGVEQMLQKFQRIGFGWTRWFPETKWHNFQKKAGEPFHWFEKEFALAAKYGVLQHVVLYGWPEGLMDKEHSGQPLLLDMKWPADDPHWDDLSIETAWDKYVKAAATHFRGQPVIFEIENEPEFDKWEKHHAEYAKFTIRTARLLRATDSAAKIMVNKCMAFRAR